MPTMTNATSPGILLDADDFDLNALPWHLDGNGAVQHSTYDASTQMTGKIKLHRVIASRMTGRELLRSEEVDHINGDRQDNRRSNLRVVSHRQNQMNQGSHGGTSRFVGVCRYKRGWLAGITFEGKYFGIGVFDGEEHAAWMRDQYAIALHEDFARLNFKYVEVEKQR